MTDFGGLAQVIIAIATLVSALGAVVLGILNRVKIEQVHIATNSKMDKLLNTATTAAKAQGVLIGQANPGVPPSALVDPIVEGKLL